jgi:hypothetical protein
MNDHAALDGLHPAFNNIAGSRDTFAALLAAAAITEAEANAYVSGLITAITIRRAAAVEQS